MNTILNLLDKVFGRRMKKRALMIVGQHWAEWVKFAGTKEGWIDSHGMYVCDELEIIMRKIEKL